MCTGNGQSGMAGIAGLANSAQQQVRAATRFPTWAEKVQGGVAAANAYTKPIVNELLGSRDRPMVFDPDLEPLYARNRAKPAFGSPQTIIDEQQRRNDLKAQNEAIKVQREAAVADQQKQMVTLQQQQQAEVVRQAEQTRQFERDRAAQQQQIAGTRAASQAVSQSLQILSSQSGQQAPTAVEAKRKGQQARPRTAATSLRMGSTSSAAGAGPNIAV
jgi:hypothetical protein